ncbi:MAG: hypothetical protein JRN62_04870 [Nitrososphaerota archaeon]|nr:hypothetical protein [Nitrososphaerota archaeon]
MSHMEPLLSGKAPSIPTSKWRDGMAASRGRISTERGKGELASPETGRRRDELLRR